MNDADYCVVGTSKPTSSYLNNIMLRWNVAQTTSAFALFAGSYNTIPADCLEAHVAVFGS